MISLPIPLKEAPATYGSIQRDGINFGALTSDLTKGRIPPSFRAHLDPDLDSDAVPRPAGWRPLFGQVDASLSHLSKEGVGAGDLFLFFGWFRPAECVNGRWRYVPGSASVHALWGWLSIGETHDVSAAPDSLKKWAAGHPHLSGMTNRQNRLFVAADDLRVGRKRFDAAGLFTHADHRVLTQAGANRSTWRLPNWMHPDERCAELSYHRDAARWARTDGKHCRLQAVSKGQEFVLKCQDAGRLSDWLASVFSD